jgi:hypothetical protein
MTSQEAVLLIDISLTNEKALNVVETYARIQIENDRERIKAIPTKFEAKQRVSTIINELPITLD